MRKVKVAKIKDWYRGVEVVGRLIAECESFEELGQALSTVYKNGHNPGSQGKTEA